MAFSLYGIMHSYDYSELIEQLQKELDQKTLSSSSTIYVLRDEKRKIGGFYSPILEYKTEETEGYEKGSAKSFLVEMQEWND